MAPMRGRIQRRPTFDPTFQHPFNLNRPQPQFQDGAAFLAEENRRMAEDNAMAFREDSRQRQVALLGELSALNREVRADGGGLGECGQVEQYRLEASTAGSALHAHMERMAARMAADEQQLAIARQANAAAADEEAAQLAALRAQIAEMGAALQVRGCRGEGRIT
eukprot:359935-Chlamydomonas_euryale.AAC.3